MLLYHCACVHFKLVVRVALVQVPLALSGLIFFVMSCHHRGRNRELANQAHEELDILLECFCLDSWAPTRMTTIIHDTSKDLIQKKR